jgi:cytochrome c peroxidase
MRNLCIAASVVAIVVVTGLSIEPEVDPSLTAYGWIGARKLAQDFAAWSRAHERNGADRSIRIALQARRAAGHGQRAAGEALVDPIDGGIEVQARGLPAGEFEAWVVDRRAAGQRAALRIGALTRQGGSARLSVHLAPRTLERVPLDVLVVAPSGVGREQAVLEGAPSLFQRLYAELRSTPPDSSPRVAAADSLFSRVLGAGEAHAASGGARSQRTVEQLVERGARIFTQETFGGNGRTCATCHPLDRNTTLSASDIARLRDDDPLFVAEFRASLAFAPDGPKFEVPPLMRGAALILENVDGRQDLVRKFVMRAIPHTLALRTSIQPGNDGTAVPPRQRLGWGGDGAADDGSLRSFARGAVEQHFTKTLARIPGVDFREPSEDELDALEAFQLSLGRQSDPNLPLPLRDPVVSRGQQLFLARGSSGAGNCVVCHFNAGASARVNGVAAGNFVFATGVEFQQDRPADLILGAAGLDLAPDADDTRVPADGGFLPEGDPNQFGAGTGSLPNGFGTGFFNTPPLIEAADTPPFFHDNSVRTIEGAVAFYAGVPFNFSPSGASDPTQLDAPQIEAIAAFLRALNALENLRQTRELLQAVRDLDLRQIVRAPSLLRQAAVELDDAVKVLGDADLQPEVVLMLERARRQLALLEALRIPPRRGVEEVLQVLAQARSRIVAN